MSVINQVLLDLEKRRASAAERGVLPNHVRALPDSGRGAALGMGRDGRCLHGCSARGLDGARCDRARC